MRFDQITIVGVGLIGGSVGLAAKARGIVGRVVGVDRDPTRLDAAARVGAIDDGTTDLATGVRDATLVVVCTPVDRIGHTIRAVLPHVRPGTLFTDVGSTKGNILRDLGEPVPYYVPAHPLAGSEKSGPEHARADLFDGRVTVLTPVGTDPAAVRAVGGFWEALGCRVGTLAPNGHDRILAVTSHLPHAVAAGVAGMTQPEHLDATAGGFRDVTRVAAGDPHLWAGIFQANRDAVLRALDRFAGRMAEFRNLLDANDADGLVRWLADAKQVRDALGT